MSEPTYTAMSVEDVMDIIKSDNVQVEVTEFTCYCSLWVDDETLQLHFGQQDPLLTCSKTSTLLYKGEPFIEQSAVDADMPRNVVDLFFRENFTRRGKSLSGFLLRPWHNVDSLLCIDYHGEYDKWSVLIDKALQDIPSWHIATCHEPLQLRELRQFLNNKQYGYYSQEGSDITLYTHREVDLTPKAIDCAMLFTLHRILTGCIEGKIIMNGWPTLMTRMSGNNNRF